MAESPSLPSEEGEVAEHTTGNRIDSLMRVESESHQNDLLTPKQFRRPDIPPEDQYGTGRGQSYRPSGARERTPPPVRSDSYRARPRSPPPRRDDYGDTYRAPRARSRSPPRRDDFRRRSPSPRFRDRDTRPAGGDSYRGRPRSPPRREELPRDDLFRRDAARDPRDFREEWNFRDDRDLRDGREYGNDRDRGFAAARERSQPPRFRDRSPVPLKRGREPSPIGSRGRRTPPPAKRERLQSPAPRIGYADYAPSSRPTSPPRRRFSPEPRERRPSPRGMTRDYRLRSRSPTARNERVDPRAVDDWRKPRSPSPRYSRPEYLAQEENGGRDSVATSRRSSPPVHPSRMRQVDERPSYDARDSYRAKSPEPRRLTSPIPRERGYSEDREYVSQEDRIPPPREPYRADDAPAPRAPPTGPAGHHGSSSNMAPPTGPAAAAVPISAHARAPVVPPSGPRAGGPSRGDFGAPRGRGGFRGDFGGGRGGFGGPPFRGGRGGAGTGFIGRGGPPPGPSSFSRSESFDRDSEYNGLPSGPRDAPPAGPRNSFSQAGSAPAFRPSNNSTATTYPRSQRFGPGGQPLPESTTPTGPRAARRPTEPALDRRSSGPHLAIADLPKPIEGGKRAEPLADRTRLDKLQEEAEKLRKAIDEKEKRNRKGLREWDRLSRDTEAAAFRSQLAEEALRNASGETESTAAF